MSGKVGDEISTRCHSGQLDVLTSLLQLTKTLHAESGVVLLVNKNNDELYTEVIFVFTLNAVYCVDVDSCFLVTVSLVDTCHVLTHFMPPVSFYAPENIRKLQVF